MKHETFLQNEKAVELVKTLASIDEANNVVLFSDITNLSVYINKQKNTIAKLVSQYIN